MPFRISCPHCRAGLMATEELIGQEAVCHHCKRTIKVESPEPAAVGAATARAAAAAPGSPARDGEPLPPAAPRPTAPPLAVSGDGSAPAGPARVIALPAVERRPSRRKLQAIVEGVFCLGNPADVSLLLT